MEPMTITMGEQWQDEAVEWLEPLLAIWSHWR